MDGAGYARKGLECLDGARAYARENGLGVAGSLLLHGLAALLVLLAVVQHASPRAHERSLPFVPVDLIRLGAETQSPPAETKALIPHERAGRPQEAASLANRTVSPNGSKPAPEDALDAKLHALARLQQPPTPLGLAEGQGVSNLDAADGEPGDAATYSIRDYVLAQVLRRWTLNLARAGGQRFVIPIRVVMKRDGTIASAELVDIGRTKSDVVYRDLAVGARNAVLLSSPIALPPGDYPKEMRFTLRLDTRAAVR